ncbi:MAG TPA: GNAT family protein [Candidatus Tectomicrobia bacterium]
MTLTALPRVPVPTTVTITDTPSRAALQQWWRARHTDPDRNLAFTDDAPHTFAALCACIAAREHLFFLAQAPTGEVIGAMWLHDLIHDAEGTPRAGWLGTYVLPAYRGTHTTQSMWSLVRHALETCGIQNVYIASHGANTRAHRVAETHLGFHRVGLFPAFARFGGHLTDCLILSMRVEDMGEAWAFAYVRAQHGVVGHAVRGPVQREKDSITQLTD